MLHCSVWVDASSVPTRTCRLNSNSISSRNRLLGGRKTALNRGYWHDVAGAAFNACADKMWRKPLTPAMRKQQTAVPETITASITYTYLFNF